MREDAGGRGKPTAVFRWPAMEVQAAVGRKEVRTVWFWLFCKWSQQDFLVIGGL